MRRPHAWQSPKTGQESFNLDCGLRKKSIVEPCHEGSIEYALNFDGRLRIRWLDGSKDSYRYAAGPSLLGMVAGMRRQDRGVAAGRMGESFG